MSTKYFFDFKTKSEKEKTLKDLEDFFSKTKAKSRLKAVPSGTKGTYVLVPDDESVDEDDNIRSFKIQTIRAIKNSSFSPLRKLSNLVKETTRDRMEYLKMWPSFSLKLEEAFHFEDGTCSSIVDLILDVAEKDVENGIERTVKEWYDLIVFILEVATEKRPQVEVKVDYEEALANSEAQCEKFEKLAKEANNKQKELEKEISQLRSQLEAKSKVLVEAQQSMPNNRLAIAYETAIDSYEKKVKTLEKKNKELQEKLNNAGETLTVLAEGVKEYVDEVGVDKAYDLFNRLNTILIDVPAWTKHASALKKVFKIARKEMQNRGMVQGDLVVNKHVDKEVNGVSPGATGILINKNED